MQAKKPHLIIAMSLFKLHATIPFTEIIRAAEALPTRAHESLSLSGENVDQVEEPHLNSHKDQNIDLVKQAISEVFEDHLGEEPLVSLQGEGDIVVGDVLDTTVQSSSEWKIVRGRKRNKREGLSVGDDNDSKCGHDSEKGVSDDDSSVSSVNSEENLGQIESKKLKMEGGPTCLDKGDHEILPLEVSSDSISSATAPEASDLCSKVSDSKILGQ